MRATPWRLRSTATVRARSSITAISRTRPVSSWTQKPGTLSRVSPFSIVPEEQAADERPDDD